MHWNKENDDITKCKVNEPVLLPLKLESVLNSCCFRKVVDGAGEKMFVVAVIENSAI